MAPQRRPYGMLRGLLILLIVGGGIPTGTSAAGGGGTAVPAGSGVSVNHRVVTAGQGGGQVAPRHSDPALSLVPLLPSVSKGLNRSLASLTLHPVATPASYGRYLAPASAHPLQRAIPPTLDTLYGKDAERSQPVGPYRTTVLVGGTTDLVRLQAMSVTVLGATANTATVIVDRLQLEELARLHFFPHGTDLAAHLTGAGGARISASATAAAVLASTGTDSDGDGLTDTEEGWWCTDPHNADSNNDRVSDGAAVQGLIDWVRHVRTTRPASGKPFAGWPPDHTGCYDSDYDSVPDAVEVYVFGLNPNRESTPRDKFDDGQKLFGITDCPGSGGGCGYGALPRAVDWGVIFAEMPSWVKPPYDSPYVAAFPQPDIEVVDNSIKVTAKTIIQSTTTAGVGDSKTYGTSETRGTSSSVANTASWNNWQEVAVSKPQSSALLMPSTFHLGQALSSVRLNRRLSSAKSSGFNLGNLFSSNNSIDASSSLRMNGTAQGCVAVACANVNATINGDVVNHFDPSFHVSIGCILFCNSGTVQNNVNNCYQGCPSQGGTYVGNQQLIDRGGRTIQAQDNSAGGSETYDYANGSQSGSSVPLNATKYYQISYPSPPEPTITNTSGHSAGGAQTTTHTEYEEHTTSQSQQFMNSTSWATASSTDTVHAADLTFNYRISNKGSDYAKEINNIAFNIYLGNNSNPIYTYFPAADIGGSGGFTNFMPGETHTYASRAVPLTLDEMRAIDLGSPLFVTVEDYSYGADELFYQDSINSGVTFDVDSGDGLLHSYVLPTWGAETVQDVARRLFPATVDANNNLLSLSLPNYSTSPMTWANHALTDKSWWNLYLSNLGDGSTLFKDTSATSNSTVLIRMNQDSDQDGYSDRTELAFGTNPNDPASHPTPQLIAATYSITVGNVVTTTMSFQNTGPIAYDAYGVEAVMYAPDSTTTIGNNTIGGSGRVGAGQQVVLGSRILLPSVTGWHGSAQPHSTGSYSGNVDKTFVFTATNTGNIGNGVAGLTWDDGTGVTGTLNVGGGYTAPLPITVSDGLQVGFDTGTINAGDVFTVGVQLPTDTFTYTVNSGDTPPTPPVVVVSYNDPQGNHKFVTPVQVGDLNTDLSNLWVADAARYRGGHCHHCPLYADRQQHRLCGGQLSG